MSEPRNFNDPRWVAIRNRVYARDNYKCQMPGCNSGRSLNCHHIKRHADCPELRFTESNLIAVCRSCHDRLKNHENEFAALLQGIVAAKSSGGQAAIDVLFAKYRNREQA